MGNHLSDKEIEEETEIIFKAITHLCVEHIAKRLDLDFESSAILMMNVSLHMFKKALFLTSQKREDRLENLKSLIKSIKKEINK